jgi:glutathione S-transferase
MIPLPILYSFRRCPYAMRARFALLVSGQPVEIREVTLRDKPAAMLAASPKGTVPVLVLPDGTVIDQSLDIMRWALRQKDPENWLAGDDAELLAMNDGPFKHHLDRAKYPERYGSDPVEQRIVALGLLAELEDRLAGTGQLCGVGRRLTDMALFPFIRQFAAIDPDWFGGQPLPYLQRWLTDHGTSDLFARAFLRLSPWQEGNVPIHFGG